MGKLIREFFQILAEVLFCRPVTSRSHPLCASGFEVDALGTASVVFPFLPCRSVCEQEGHGTSPSAVSRGAILLSLSVIGQGKPRLSGGVRKGGSGLRKWGRKRRPDRSFAGNIGF